MKLINANSTLFLVMLAVVSSCKYKPEQQLITGSWKYLSITIGDSSATEISNYDYLDLNADSTFQYDIESIKKHMTGKWSYDAHTLHLDYDVPDTTRHFEIDVLTKSQLHFHEQDMVFRFSRID